jgi:hypothetical protein
LPQGKSRSAAILYDKLSWSESEDSIDWSDSESGSISNSEGNDNESDSEDKDEESIWIMLVENTVVNRS